MIPNHDPQWYVDHYRGPEETLELSNQMRARANELSEESKALWFDAHELSRISEIYQGRAIHVNEVSHRNIQIQSLPLVRVAIIHPDFRNQDRWTCTLDDYSQRVGETIAYGTREEAIRAGKNWCAFVDSSPQE